MLIEWIGQAFFELCRKFWRVQCITSVYKSLQRSSTTVINVALASLLATLLPAIAAAEIKRWAGPEV